MNCFPWTRIFGHNFNYVWDAGRLWFRITQFFEVSPIYCPFLIFRSLLKAVSTLGTPRTPFGVTERRKLWRRCFCERNMHMLGIMTLHSIYPIFPRWNKDKVSTSWQTMLNITSSFDENGTMFAQHSPPSSSDNIVRILKTHRRISFIKQRTHEFHSGLRSSMLRFIPRKQLSYHQLHNNSHARLPLLKQ